jgi:hypothetical protein
LIIHPTCIFMSLSFFIGVFEIDFLDFLCLLSGGPLPPILASIRGEKSLQKVGKPYMGNDRVNLG